MHFYSVKLGRNMHKTLLYIQIATGSFKILSLKQDTLLQISHICEFGPAKFKISNLYHIQSKLIVICGTKGSKITTLYMLQHTGYIYLLTLGARIAQSV